MLRNTLSGSGWDGQGACLFSKRLEKGRFVWPSAKEGKIALTAAQLAMLLAPLGSMLAMRLPGNEGSIGVCHSAVGLRSRRDKCACGIPASPLFCYGLAMLDIDKSLPNDPDELRQFTALLLAEVKSQAVLIEKLRHQLAGQRHHRFGSSSESIEQLQLALETSEIAVAKMTAKLRLPDEEPKDKPKRRPIPDHIPRMEVELTTGDDDCAQCAGSLRGPGEDVTEELEYVPGRFIVNRIVRPRFACSGCEAFTQAAATIAPHRARASWPGAAGPCSDQ